MDENEINEELKRLKSSSKEYANLVDNLIRDRKRMGDDDKKAGETTIKFIKATEEANKRFKKSYLEIDSSIKILNEAYKKGALSAEDLEEELDQLRNQINKTTDQDKKAALIRSKSELERANAGNKASEIFTNSLATMSGTIAKGFVNQMTAAAKAALGGGDAMDIAAASMTAKVDMYNNTVQAGAGALMDVGKAAAGAGGKLGKAGIAAAGLGAAISMVSGGMSDLAKAGIGFMLTQTRQLIGNFQEMSASGAIYSGGMMEMIGSSQNAGMTLEQFSKSVATNRDVLSKAGVGVGEASKKLSAAMAAGGQSARQGMYALGMNMEQQADAYAQTIGLMAGPSGQLKASNAEVAAQTEEYARNLKTISNITGQDAKARMEKVRQDNDTLAFNSYLNGLGETERKKTVEAMALMSAEDARAFREKQIYGQVISRDLNIARATNDGIRKAQDAQFALAQQGNLDLAGVAKSYQDNQKEILEQSNNLGKTLGRVQSGAGADAAKAINSVAQYAIKFADAEKTATLVAERQNAGKQGAGGPEVNLMEENQRLLTRMQALAADNLGLFAGAVSKTVDELDKQIEALKNVAKGDVVGGIMDFVKQNLGTLGAIVGTAVLSGVLTPKQDKGAKEGKVVQGLPSTGDKDKAPNTKQAARVAEAEAGNKAYRSTIGTPQEKEAVRAAAMKEARKEFFASQRAASSAPTAAPTAASKASGLLSKLSSGISSVLPTVSGTFSKLGSGLSAAIPVLQKVSKATPYIGSALATFSAVSDIKDVNQQVQNKEITKEQGQEKKGNIAGGGVGAAAGAVLGGVLGSVVGPVGTVAGAALGAYLGKKFGEAITEAFGSKKIGEMVDSISDSIGKFGDYAGEIFSNLGTKTSEMFDNLPKHFENFKKFASETFSNLGTKTSEIFSKLDKTVTETVNDIIKALPELYTSGMEMLGNLGTAISDTFTKSKDWVVGKVNDIGTFISDTFNSITGMVAGVGTAISDTFTQSKDWVVGKVDAIGTAISSTFNAIPGVVASVGTAISDTFTKSKDWVVGKVNDIGTFISDAFNRIPGVVASVGTAISDTFNRIPIVVIANALVTAVSGTFNKLPGVVAGVGTGISATFNKLPGVVAGVGSAIGDTFNKLPGVVAGVGTGISDTFAGVGTGISSTFAGVGSAISDTFNRIPVVVIANALVTGISDTFNKLPGVVAGVGTGISDTFNKLPGVVAGVGSAISDTFNRIPGVVASVGTGISDTFNAIPGVVAGVGTAISSTFNAIPGVVAGVGTAISDTFNKLPGVVAGVGTGISDTFNRIPGVVAGVGSGISSTFAGVGSAISDTFNRIPVVVMANALVTGISDTFNRIPGVVASVGTAISDTFNRIPVVVIANALVTGISDTFNKLPGVVAGVGSGISDTFNDAKNKVGSIVNGIGSVVASTFGGISEIVASVGAIIDKTTSTIASGVGYAFQSITGGISKVGTVVTSVGSGIAGTIKGVGRAIAGMTTAPLQLVADLVQKITDLMPEFVKMGAVKFAGAVGDAASAVGGAVSAFGGTVGNVAGNVGSTVATAFSDLIKFGSNTGDEQHFNQLDQSVRSRFTQMATEYNQQTGKSLQVNSAFRSPEEQAAVNPGTNPKAMPGKSLHNVGRAVDINSGQVTELASAGLLAKYGFSPLPGDPPHIQSLDSGGDIPSGQMAMAGERGGELITGPASVTGRVTTEMMVSRLSDLVDLSKQMISINQDMIRVMSDHKDVSRKILNATV